MAWIKLNDTITLENVVLVGTDYSAGGPIRYIVESTSDTVITVEKVKPEVGELWKFSNSRLFYRQHGERWAGKSRSFTEQELQEYGSYPVERVYPPEEKK